MKILVLASLHMDQNYILEAFPKPGQTVLAKEAYLSRGGKGQNQAVAICRCGGHVGVFGAVGRDENGTLLEKALEEDGVDIRYLMKKDCPTGRASIYIQEDGENTIVVYPGADFAMTLEDLEGLDQALEEVQALVLQLELPLNLVYRALEVAKKKGVLTFLNPAPAVVDFDQKYLAYVDFLIPNEGELSDLLGRKISSDQVEEAARELLNKGVGQVLVTLGSRGSLLLHADGSFYQEAHKVKAVDTTGAGDAYIGAFVQKYLEKKDIKKAMAFATNYAARVVEAYGALDSFPLVEDD